jgi:acyl-coenzyme A thioesterase PaaI-like protein
MDSTDTRHVTHSVPSSAAERFDPAAAGWKPLKDPGFTQHIGPIWARREGEVWIYGLLPEAKHLNSRGVVHGGMLMSFADEALSLWVWEAAERKRCATIQLDTHFLAAIRPGQFVIARGEVTRRTRSVLFVRGSFSVGEREVATAKGIWKVLGAD